MIAKIYTYINKENQNYCKTHPTHGYSANWCQNTLLVLGEVCEYNVYSEFGIGYLYAVPSAESSPNVNLHKIWGNFLHLETLMPLLSTSTEGWAYEHVSAATTRSEDAFCLT